MAELTIKQFNLKLFEKSNMKLMNILVNFIVPVIPLNIVLHSSLGGRSHIKGVLEVGEDLTRRGHRVSYVGLEDNLSFVRGYNITTYSLGHPGLIKHVHPKMLHDHTSGKQGIDFDLGFMEVFIKWMVGNYQIEFPLLKKLLPEIQPDAMVCDFCAAACQDVAEVMGIPLITGIQSVDGLGIIDAPYITRGMQYGPLSVLNMNLFDRFYSTLYVDKKNKQFWDALKKGINYVRELYGVPIRLGPQGALHYGMAIANSYTGFETAMDIPPNIQLVGPLLSEITSPLPSWYGSFLKIHSHTLYIGFGSHINLDARVINIVLETVLLAIDKNVLSGAIWGLGQTQKESFPSHVFVKDRKVDITNHPHLKIVKWAPQPQLLAHANIKLFLSHGGIESIFESIDSATPLLVLPYLGDQPRNARKVQNMGVGLYVDPLTLSASSLLSQIDTVIADQNGNFHANLIRMQSISHQQTLRRPLASLLIESYVANAQACRPLLPHKLGTPPCELQHLLPDSTKMSFMRSQLLDVYLTGFIIVSFIIILSLVLSFSIIKRVLKENHFKLHCD